MKQIDVIRISIQLHETNGPHAILALPVKKRELDQLLADKEYVRLVPVDDLERALRMKQIDSRIAELNKSIEKSENTINGYQYRLPQLKKMLITLKTSSDERTSH